MWIVSKPERTASQFFVTAIAQHTIVTVFARAEIGSSRLFRFIFYRDEVCALVVAVAKWLGLTLTARTPPIAFACLHINRTR
ncbi:hypothetical protein CCP3SC1_140010 [Gammaproteobacteria bacterium]